VRKGAPQKRKEPSEKSASKDVSVGGMTSMVYASKTDKKIQYDADNKDIKVDFGIESGVNSEVAHPIFKNGTFGKAKRNFLAQMPVGQRRQTQLADSKKVDVVEKTLVVMFNAEEVESL